jgi:hypothetical protein
MMRATSEYEKLSVVETQYIVINEHISMGCCVIYPRLFMSF